MLSRSKTQARQVARATRATLASETAAQELKRVFSDVGFEQVCIAGFAPIGDEIDVWPLLNHLHEAGRKIALPVVTAPAHPLTFRRWTPGSKMQTDPYGVSYPAQGEALTPQLLLIPLLAFTPDGKRLGYGGGYYDRTLSKLRAEGDVFACGVAYAGQEVADLPTDAHDARLDGILTEQEFRTFR